jgi:iron(III) transport system substrate-binding protein
MTPLWTRRAFLSGAIATLTLWGGYISQQSSLLAQGQTLNVYSSRHYNTDQKLYDEFTRQTGIKVNVIEAEADPLIVRIKSEGKNSPADVLLTADAGRLWRATQEGLLAPANSSVLRSKIPANLRDKENRWFGFSRRARVIIYNKDKVKAGQIKTYADLTKPQWRGKVLTRSSSNIYSQSLVAWMLVERGEKATTAWCQGLVANFGRSPQGNDKAQIDGVASGAGEVAIVNTYYLASYATDKDPKKRAIFDKIGIVFPDQNSGGTHINISGGGLVTTAPNKAQAIKFLEYLASPKAQAFFAQANNEYPVVQGIPLDPVVAKWGNFKASKVSVAEYGPNLAKGLKIMTAVGWK